MRFGIKHEIKGRLRIHVKQSRMSYREADMLQHYLSGQSFITSVKVETRTLNAVICYEGKREQVIRALQQFDYNSVEVPDFYLENSGRELNEQYKEKLVTKIILHYGKKWLLPMPFQTAIAVWNSVKYIREGIKCLWNRKVEVPVLDATAISVSMLRGDFKTAGSVMFLLGIGEILEEWTHKKSVDDLARSMSLNNSKVWLSTEQGEVLVPADQVHEGDKVVVHIGNVVPFDGVVVEGDAMVNQASLTGESVPVRKESGGYVYAGTVLEEGELIIDVKKVNGASRFERIVSMIEESEKLKSSLEGKAEHLADKLVPYTLVGTALTYLLTRNVTKTLAVLMVDFSCALKLAMPISVLSAIREASGYHITVKGGKFLEAMSEADTIIFDKTGTLTLAEPTVKQVISFNGQEPDELLRIAACMEEHFLHSMSKAVVQAAKDKGLEHEEMHTKVNYIVAHGISTTINGKRAIIGSRHFVFEDENCVIPEGKQELFDSLKPEYSHLYLAIEQQLVAVICIEDPIRKEAAEVVRLLKDTGITKVVMMTGDNRHTAQCVAAQVGVDELHAEVLPEDKANFVIKEKEAGRKVIMIGDGINDSPALSAADVGIAMNDGAEIAREIADVTINAYNLYSILVLKEISDALMKRIQTNYRRIVGINGALIALGVAGVIQPTTSALLHNTSTLVISLRSMRKLLI